MDQEKTAFGLAAAEAQTVRRKQAWELRVKGLSMFKIGEQLKVSHQTVMRDLKHVREHFFEDMRDGAQRHLTLDLARLDDAMARAWLIVTDAGSSNIERLHGIETVHKIIRTRMEVYGAVGRGRVIDEIVAQPVFDIEDMRQRLSSPKEQKAAVEFEIIYAKVKARVDNTGGNGAHRDQGPLADGAAPPVVGLLPPPAGDGGNGSPDGDDAAEARED
jgi:hypothetical protein